MASVKLFMIGNFTKNHLNHYFDNHVHLFMRVSVYPFIRHKKLTLPNQQMLRINVVAYDLVMKNITLGSPPTPKGL